MLWCFGVYLLNMTRCLWSSSMWCFSEAYVSLVVPSRDAKMKECQLYIIETMPKRVWGGPKRSKNQQENRCIRYTWAVGVNVKRKGVTPTAPLPIKGPKDNPTAFRMGSRRPLKTNQGNGKAQKCNPLAFCLVLLDGISHLHA